MKTYVEQAKVLRTFETTTGFGVTVVEENDVNGRTFTQHATLWFKTRKDVEVGDLVSASGHLYVRVRSYETSSGGTRTVADVNLNGAHIQSITRGQIDPSGDVRGGQYRGASWD